MELETSPTELPSREDTLTMTNRTPRDGAAIVCFGEVLMRLASRSPTLLFQEPTLEASFCGAEANVAVALAGFGHRCTMVTSLPDNPLGERAARTLQGLGVACEAGRMARSRLGLFFLEPGAMNRPSKIIYDRAGSAFASAKGDRYDWTALLLGAHWLFVSGITAALGDEALGALRAAIRAARLAGVRIAFDTNFRPTLWQGREAQAAEIFRELASESDLVFAGRRAAAMMTGRSFGGSGIDQGFGDAARALFDLSPSILYVAATRRDVRSSDSQQLTGLLADRDGLAVQQGVALERIVDRVGTGDAYAAGIVHGLASGFSREAAVAFAIDCAQWAHSVPGDFLRATLDDIASLSESGDIRR